MADFILRVLTPEHANSLFVVVRNHDGTPVTTDKYVVLTLTPDGTEVDDIAVYNTLDEVGD